jgi:hypothetical protein
LGLTDKQEKTILKSMAQMYLQHCLMSHNVEKDIFTLTFEEICEYGDWGYQELTSKEEEIA